MTYTVRTWSSAAVGSTTPMEATRKVDRGMAVARKDSAMPTATAVALATPAGTVTAMTAKTVWLEAMSAPLAMRTVRVALSIRVMPSLPSKVTLEGKPTKKFRAPPAVVLRVMSKLETQETVPWGTLTE